MIIELENIKNELGSYTEPVAELKKALDLDNKANRVEELEQMMQAPDFWDDPEKSQQLSKELKDKKDDIEICARLEASLSDIADLIEIANEENDESMIDDIKTEYETFKTDLETIRLKTLLSDPYDKNNAILRLNAGAGGTESCDWCSMLYRMYSRWAERRGFRVEVLDSLDGDEAGIKSITFQIDGENAYGYLKSEHGVHRLVRISPFNAQGKRQTSFVSLDVMPEINDVNPTAIL